MPLFRLSLPGDDLVVELPLPDAVRGRDAEAIDLSAIPSASLIGRKSWGFGDGGRIELACVKSSAAQWVPGLEHSLLTGATALVREQFDLHSVKEGLLESTSGAYWLSFAGLTATADRPVQGRHVLGFVGQSPSLIVCSSTCVAGDDAGACADTVHGMTVEGALVAPPPPGLGLSLLLGAAKHPAAVLGISAALAIAIVTLLLWRRPRPAH